MSNLISIKQDYSHWVYPIHQCNEETYRLSTFITRMKKYEVEVLQVEQNQ